MANPPTVTARRFGGDIWRLHADGVLVVIPTNLFCRNDGRNVMGAGLAKQARRRFRGLERRYGDYLRGAVRPDVAAGAPVEPDKVAERRLWVDEPDGLLCAAVKWNWWQPADLQLVDASLAELADFIVTQPDATVALPRLGCGNGGLDWESQVKPVVRAFLLELDTAQRRQVIIVDPPDGA